MTVSRKDPRLYLIHILECIEKITRFTVAGKEAFFSSPLIQDAVYRNFEVIGEAAKRIPAEVRAFDETIPWRTMAGLRDVIIHQYDGVDPTGVWAMIENDLAPLAGRLRAVLERMGGTG